MISRFVTRRSNLLRHFSSMQQMYVFNGSETKDMSGFIWRREQLVSTSYRGDHMDRSDHCNHVNNNRGCTWSGLWNQPSVVTSMQIIASHRLQQMRCFASKTRRVGKGKKNERALDEPESDDDDIVQRDKDDLERDWDPEIDEDETNEDEATKEWKDIQQHVPSLRVDAVFSAGLGISRKKIEEAYLSMRLRINGEKVSKKSRQVKDGDILDVILEHGTNSHIKGEGNGEGMSVMRLQILEISTDRTGKDRVPVLLRRWKHLKITKEKK